MALQPVAAMSPNDLRRVFGRFTTGVVVVTARADGGPPHGMTVNSFTSVSLGPPLVLVCLQHRSRTTEAVRSSGAFAISVLGARQEHMARRFAAPGEDHFEDFPHSMDDQEVPSVPDALAHLECVVEHRVVAGDHDIVVGRVLKAHDREGDPLAFFGGRFGEYVGRDYEPFRWLF